MEKRKKQVTVGGIIVGGVISILIVSVLPFTLWYVEESQKEKVGPLYDFCIYWVKNPDGTEKCEYVNRMVIGNGTECPKFEKDSAGREFCVYGERRYLED